MGVTYKEREEETKERGLSLADPLLKWLKPLRWSQGLGVASGSRMWVAGAQLLGLSYTAFPRLFAENWTGSGAGWNTEQSPHGMPVLQAVALPAILPRPLKQPLSLPVRITFSLFSPKKLIYLAFFFVIQNFMYSLTIFRQIEFVLVFL